MRFPDGRLMTPDEKRGYDLACEGLQVWGAQVAKAGRELGRKSRDNATIPLNRLMEHSGNMVMDLARCMQREGEVAEPAPALLAPPLH